MTYTTTLSLNRAWLTAASNPLDRLVCGTSQSADRTYGRAGNVRQYASGRRQSASGSTFARTRGVTLIGLPIEGLTWLEQHIGTTILFRSRSGERIYCTYYSMNVRDIDHSAVGASSLTAPAGYSGIVHNVTIELTEVDYIEASL